MRKLGVSKTKNVIIVLLFFAFSLLSLSLLLGWSQGLTSNLQHSYNFTIKDAIYTYDAVNNTNMDINVSGIDPTNCSGKIGDGIGLYGAQNYGNMSQVIDYPNGTFAVWFYLNESVAHFFGKENEGDPTDDNRFFTKVSVAGGNYWVAWGDGGAGHIIVPNMTAVNNAWSFFVVTWGSTGMRVYLNSTIIGNDSSTDGPDLLTGWHFGRATGSTSETNGLIKCADEFLIWDRALTPSEISELYNNYNGQTYPIGPEITLNNPTNNQNVTDSSVTFAVTPISQTGETLIAILWGNWSGVWASNESNLSIASGSQTNFTITGIPDGKYIWNAETNDSVTYPLNYTFVKDTTGPVLDLPVYSNNTIVNTTQTLTINVSVFDEIYRGDVCLINVNGTNNTIAVNNGWCNSTLSMNNTPYGNYPIYVWVNDTLNNWNSDQNYYFILDEVAPNITITSPTGEDNDTSILYNVSLSDLGSLDSCIYWVTRGASVDVSNVSITCNNSVNGNFTVSSLGTNYTFYFFSNDSLGNYYVNSSNFSTSPSSTIILTSSGGGGGSSGENTIPAVAIIQPTQDIGIYSNLSRAIWFARINDSCLGKLKNCILNENQKIDLVNILDEQGVLTDVVTIEYWLKNYNDGKIENVIVTLKQSQDYNLVVSGVSVLEQEFRVISPTNPDKLFIAFSDETSFNVLLNKEIKNCTTLVGGDVGFSCDNQVSFAIINFKIPENSTFTSDIFQKEISFTSVDDEVTSKVFTIRVIIPTIKLGVVLFLISGIIAFGVWKRESIIKFVNKKK